MFLKGCFFSIEEYYIFKKYLFLSVYVILMYKNFRVGECLYLFIIKNNKINSSWIILEGRYYIIVNVNLLNYFVVYWIKIFL